MDDFGTGNANYSYVKFFSPNYLKIDKMFTSCIENDVTSRRVISSIIELAMNLDCYVIAEGIETESQKNMLKELGVSFFQGYYFNKAVPIHEFNKLLSLQLLAGGVKC
nr:EAL domain-containing protein [Enterobacter asburiae]